VVGGQRQAPAALPLGKRPGIRLYEAGWTSGPVWRGAENLALAGIRSAGHPARSEFLYQLRYPGPQRLKYWINLST
jgi:hypothetical protein